ncbi:hypothetical protein T459_14366 [Capsicum annuum]|uniref:Uncharacterized protein n=1 Tax=Capsicum annuum TaxID=4072 RepID=A0A2G2ZHG1_CAPAN|nr:hypothetical protein T459_14366 [Capsicum annuum]
MEVKNEEGNGEKPRTPLPTISFSELFRFFADLVNSFGSYANDVDKITQEILKYAFFFLIVGAAIWASSWAVFEKAFLGLTRDAMLEQVQ